MPRTPNTHGGGALTNENGLRFEQTTSLNEALKEKGYKILNRDLQTGHRHGIIEEK